MLLPTTWQLGPKDGNPNSLVLGLAFKWKDGEGLNEATGYGRETQVLVQVLLPNLSLRTCHDPSEGLSFPHCTTRGPDSTVSPSQL